MVRIVTQAFDRSNACILLNLTLNTLGYYNKRIMMKADNPRLSRIISISALNVFRFSLFIPILLVLSMCVGVPNKASTALADEENKEKAQENKKTTQDAGQTDSITDQDISNARLKIERAEKAGAERYSPDLLIKSNKDLSDGIELRNDKPEEARVLIAASGTEADGAFDAAAKAVYSLSIEPLGILIRNLRDKEARSFYPEEYTACEEESASAEKYYADSDISKAEAAGKNAQSHMRELAKRIDEKSKTAAGLEESLAQYLARFETDGTLTREAKRIDQIIEKYFSGINALASHKLEKAIAELSLAEELCNGVPLSSANGFSLFSGATRAYRGAKEIRVGSNENLWSIAKDRSVYGDPFLWPIIWRMNMDTIPNPTLLFSGTMILIPPVPALK
jgi:nucleoid-associated protein YgaU